MASSEVTKEGHRVNMYFPADLYLDMKQYVKENNTNITELCREATRIFLHSKRRELTQKELMETCKMLTRSSNGKIKHWTTTVKGIIGNDTL